MAQAWGQSWRGKGQPTPKKILVILPFLDVVRVENHHPFWFYLISFFVWETEDLKQQSNKPTIFWLYPKKIPGSSFCHFDPIGFNPFNVDKLHWNRPYGPNFLVFKLKKILSRSWKFARNEAPDATLQVASKRLVWKSRMRMEGWPWWRSARKWMCLLF